MREAEVGGGSGEHSNERTHTSERSWGKGNGVIALARRTLRRCAECMGWASISTLPVRAERLSRSSELPARMASSVVLPEPAGQQRDGAG